jgi:hypothetical protein
VRKSSLIASYLDAVACELGSDAALSRRVLAEMEDHLWSATEAFGAPSDENQRRAIANFGDAAELARQYLMASLLMQLRRTGAVMLAALIGIFIAMKARVAWYAFVDWPRGEGWSAVRAAGLSLDRYGFMLAITLAAASLVYVGTRRAPRRFQASYGKELNRSVRLCCGVAAALAFSITTEMVLTGIRLFETQWSVVSCVPIVSLAVEAVAAILFGLQIRIMFRRINAASSLLGA